jgi:hypothetical protein
MFGKAASPVAPCTWLLQLERSESQASATLHESVAPQSGFEVLIRLISSRTSLLILGRPGRALLFQVQYSRKPLRCQAITVSGLTMSNAERHCGHTS